MKYLPTILSVTALALVGVLFYLFSHHTEQLKTISANEQRKATPNNFKIAYFDMDTLEAHYDYFKDAQAELKAKESDMNMNLARVSQNYQKKVDAWRQKGNSMTQAEAEQAQQEYARDQQAFQNQKQGLEQELYKKSEEFKNNIRKKVEAYLKDYNKDKTYSMIFAYDPGSFIYYKDTIYNITSNLLDGLNATYAADKKKN
jgi:outer membrane protein